MNFAKAQVRFVDMIGQDPDRDAVVAQLLQGPERVLADPIGLAALACYGLALGDGNAELERFLQTLIALNFETLRKPGTQEIRFDPESMSSAVASSLMLGTERYLNVRWRFRQFYEWSQSIEARGHHACVNVGQEFQDIFGMTYEDMQAAILILHTENDFEVMQLRGRAIFTDEEIVPQDALGFVRQLLARISISRQELAARVDSAPLYELRQVLMGLLITTPVIVLAPNTFLAVWGRSLDNIASLGWVYALADARRERSPRESQDFWIFFGAFFERYIADIINRIANRSDAAFWPEKVLGGLATSDAIAQYGRAFQVFEVVSGRLNAAVMRDPGDECELRRQFERLVFEKVRQLGANIRRFLQGEYRCLGLLEDQAEVVYPFLVQYNSFLKTPEFYNEVQARFRDELGAVGGDVRPVEFLDAEILECLEPHLTAELTLGSLVDEKIADIRTAPELFKNFIFYVHPELPMRWSPEIAQADSAWQEGLAARARAWRRPQR
jgi:hypothetical protein